RPPDLGELRRHDPTVAPLRGRAARHGAGLSPAIEPRRTAPGLSGRPPRGDPAAGQRRGMPPPPTATDRGPGGRPPPARVGRLPSRGPPPGGGRGRRRPPLGPPDLAGSRAPPPGRGRGRPVRPPGRRPDHLRGRRPPALADPTRVRGPFDDSPARSP